MTTESPATRQIAELQRSVTALRRALRFIQAEREHTARLRRRRLLGLGIGISIVAHLALLLYLATIHRSTGSEGIGHPAAHEVAILPLEHLSDFDDLNLDDLAAEETAAVDDPFDEPIVLAEASMPAVELESATGADPGEGLGGSGGAAADGLTGSGGATTYFGVEARGTRFAYIVDRSGSMSYAGRMEIAMSELIRSIEMLPDYTHFMVVLFSSDVLVPPMQRGWVQARRSNVLEMTRWLRTVSPGGGTMPRSSFHQLFGLDVRPDVIYFMTDGIIAPANLTAEEVADLNRRGKRVVIHTIAFGDQGSEDMLRRIARDSGGTYRFVPDGATR